MGTKHPDQISPHVFRGAAENVGQMYSKHWELTAHCRACQLVLLVDLRVVIRMKGPNFSLWNKHTQCRRIVMFGRCRGVLDFQFKAPGMTMSKALSAPDLEPIQAAGHIERALRDARRQSPKTP